MIMSSRVAASIYEIRIIIKLAMFLKKINLHLTYSIEGPLKDYDIVTEYSKMNNEELDILGITSINEE